MEPVKKYELKIMSDIDEDFLDATEEECYQVIYKQRLDYNNRWLSTFLFKKVMTFLRLSGIVFASLGMLLSIFYLAYPSSCPKWFYAEVFLLFFIIALTLFYYLPVLQEKYVGWLRGVGSKSSRKVARKFVTKAREQVPFTAEYRLKDEQVSYYRVKDDQSQHIWSRKIRGFAVTGNYATLFFRRPASLIPIMIILHEDNHLLRGFLDKINIRYE